jgi:hypothetical protein
MKKGARGEKVEVSPSESKTGRAMAPKEPDCEYGRGRVLAEVAIVVPPPGGEHE